MESRWRQNVWDFGIGDLGERMAARFVDDARTAMGWLEKPDDPSMHAWYNTPSVDGFWQFAGWRLKSNPGRNFPYGWAVEGDRM